MALSFTACPEVMQFCEVGSRSQWIICTLSPSVLRISLGLSTGAGGDWCESLGSSVN